MALAQSDPLVGWYMENPVAYNPAAVGENDLMRAFLLHRMDYVGISDAPMTTYASFCSPFKIGKTYHAAGARFMRDQYGLWTNQSFHAQYAYRHKVGKGFLSVGVDLGFANIGFRGDSVNLSQIATEGSAGGADYFVEDDPMVPTSSVSGMGFDAGVGAYYYTNTWFVGASYSHVSQPKVTWTPSSSNGRDIITRLRGTMYVEGGYNYRVKRNKKFVLKPSAMVMTDFRSWDVNLTFLTQYDERWKWGIGYRLAGSVNVLLGVEIISGLQLGYTMEIQHTKLMTEGYGSHEIYLAYGFNILRQKRTNKYKSIRYL